MANIKICGLSRPEDIGYVNEALPDYMGFVFAAKSRRYVTAEQAAALRAKLDQRIIPVGVFVDTDIELITSLVASRTISMVQLHGGQSEADICKIKEITGVAVIKAVSVRGVTDLAGVAAADYPADYLLFDNGQGGTGKRFDPDVLDQARAAGCYPDKPIFFSGGVNPTNIHEILNLGTFGIDVSSGAETNGVKDRDKILALVQAVREGDNRASISKKVGENG